MLSGPSRAPASSQADPVHGSPGTSKAYLLLLTARAALREMAGLSCGVSSTLRVAICVICVCVSAVQLAEGQSFLPSAEQRRRKVDVRMEICVL